MVRVLKQVVPHVWESSEGATVEGARLRETVKQLRRVKGSQREGHLAQRALARAQRVHQRENKPPTPPVAEALLQVRVQQILIPTPSVYKPGCLGEAHLPEKLENKNSSTSDIHLGRLNMKIHVNCPRQGCKTCYQAKFDFQAAAKLGKTISSSWRGATVIEGSA